MSDSNKLKPTKVIGAILLAPIVLPMLIYTVSFALIIGTVGFPFLLGLMLYQDACTIKDLKDQYSALLDFALFPLGMFKGGE